MSRREMETVVPATPIREAMRLMTEWRQGLVPVVDREGKLCGVIADGDVRRGLLSGISIDEPVERIMNRHPVVANVDAEQHEIDAQMRLHRKIALPIVDWEGRFIRLAMFDRTLVQNCIPHLAGREQAYVADAIAGGWLAVGPSIERFERAVAEYTGASHAIAVVSGTAALHVALVAAGVRRGDLVLVPAMTFAASANAIYHAGAEPVFFDVDPVSWGMSVDQTCRYLDEHCKAEAGELREIASGRRIGAIMPVHVYGHPVDMDPIADAAARHGVAIVEDGAESLGARYKGRTVGSRSRLCCLSFNGNKVITSGGGGMVLTSERELAQRVRYLISQAKDDPVEFVHGDIGFNYRMPNINAALGLAQAEMLPEFVARKRAITARYEARLDRGLGISMWRGANWAESSCWMSMLEIDETRHPDAVAELKHFLPSRGIEARPSWVPLHRQKPYAAARNMGIETAERIYRTTLCLPCSVGLSDSDIDRTADTINDFFFMQGK
jgi:perosamine synthetase